MQIRDDKDPDFKGTWNLDAHQAQSAPIIDIGVGQDRVIRHFVIKPDPNKPTYSAEETLRGVLPVIKRAVAKDGWTFEREPQIYALKDGFSVRTVLRPAIRNGMIMGSTNDTPDNASKLLAKGNKNLQDIKKRNNMV